MLLFIASLALSAAHPSLRLEYVAPANCPSEAAFRSLLAARLGFEPVGDPATHHASVTVEADPGALTATLALDAGRPRTFRGEPTDCENLLAAVALALATAVDPALLVRTRKAVAPSMPEPEAQAVAAVDAPTTLHLSVSAGLRSTIALLPLASFGPMIELRARYRSFSAAVDVDAAMSPAFGVEGGSIDSAVVRAGAQACGHLAFVAMCLRGAGGALSASGSGFENARRGWLPVATLGPAVSARWQPIGALVLSAGAGLDFVLIRNSIVVGTSEVWREPLVAGSFELTAGWQFL
ncbi:MAG: hypothetical protein IPJ65_20825 [Archangiaceae bacterium]|nr:hypothetical protein [Archangiaceae bacterium]